MTVEDDLKKPAKSRFREHVKILVWKSYLQRQRKWRLLLIQTIFAGILFLFAVFRAKAVFLTPLQDEPEPPLTFEDLLASSSKNVIGFAPNTSPYVEIMARVSEMLQNEILSGQTEEELNNQLYKRSVAAPINGSVIWIIWKPKVHNMHKFTIKSTERAKYVSRPDHEESEYRNSHLRSGFLGVQLAVSHSLLLSEQPSLPKYELSLVSMPVSPLMQELAVRRAIAGILLCFTLAFLPPVLEAIALVEEETISKFKYALLIRHVDYSTVYISWLVYAYLTVIPICALAAVTLILIFRWIHLMYAMMIMLAYISVMIMLALIMAMFHGKAWIACLWNVLFTLLQLFLAELLVHHGYNVKHKVVAFFLHVMLPPLGLVHVFNEFALLQTGTRELENDTHSLIYTIMSWIVMNLIYFVLLMLLQRTIGQERAIGGQVSWKSIIFKKVVDVNQLNPIVNPTGREREHLQDVDELKAIAISFRNVSKAIMNIPVLNNITLDIYRGEFTTLIAERIQEKLLITLEDLLAGLTFPDEGTITVLGEVSTPGKRFISQQNMMGYCHRCDFLLDDLTVQEHLDMFIQLCVWNEPKQFIREYSQIRCMRIRNECDLEVVRHQYVRDLDVYYRAQLCWAIAMLLEPRIVIIPYFTDHPTYTAVIKDKIMQYKNYLTIVKFCHASVQLEYCDRAFLFDSKVLVFGGTPAYMFFKYGREYRLRMTFRGGGTIDNDSITEFLERAKSAGASIRAHLGSLLILRLPPSPTANVAALIKDLTDNAQRYKTTSFSLTLPDPEEVCKRAIYEVRSTGHEHSASHELSKEVYRKVAEPPSWERLESFFMSLTHLRIVMWKYFSFYVYFRFYLIVTIISALVAGLLIGISLSNMLSYLERDHTAKESSHGKILTVEALHQTTNLVVRTDNSTGGISIATAYTLSQTNATRAEIKGITYTALRTSESITKYLVTRAIDSPQHYLYMYAYGMDVSTDEHGDIIIQALYSPLHHDQGAAARSLARVYMALMRHLTGSMDASIEITDAPLALDLTLFRKYAMERPLLIQFFLILTIAHMTLIPSKEHGMIRHLQMHAMNSSPARYWFTLYFCDLILYWSLVVLMTVVMYTVMYITVASYYFHYSDLLVVPVLLVVYGVGCVPQAYLFSVGPRAALNSMTFVIVNVVFGETTVVAKLLYGNQLSYAIYLMRMFPQFNMAYAFVKIKGILLYNTECTMFKTMRLCTEKTLHKCCAKCGVLENCFKRRQYLSGQWGILPEIVWTLITAVIFITLVLLWDYRPIQRLWRYVMYTVYSMYEEPEETEQVSSGVMRERAEVLDKLEQIKNNRFEKINTFGEYLLAANVAKKKSGLFAVRDVYFGLGKGEALAISGLKRHGRLRLAELLSGYKVPSVGQIWSLSKWKVNTNPHKYARQISISCSHHPLPSWMSIYDALEMVAILRGVPKAHVAGELWKYIDALELHDYADTLICHIPASEHTRLHFAAAVIGAPPVIVLDECTAYQKYSVRRAMYYILYQLKKRGHAIYISSTSIEGHMPITNRLGILLDGRLYDIDQVDNLVERYSLKGYTVVVHVKDEVDVNEMFGRYFSNFVINDTTEVLVNIQVLDQDLNWSTIFEKMENLKEQNSRVYSYIISAIPIDYIYNSIITNETGLKISGDFISCFCLKRIFSEKPNRVPSKETLNRLKPFEKKYDITKLKELPWSVIFNR